MKKTIAIILLICISIAVFSSCDEGHYTFSETRDFADYSPRLDFFPKSIENANVLGFGDSSYDYWSYSHDEFLVLKFNDKLSFENEVERINRLKKQYDHLEKEDYLVSGYNCLFLMCSYFTYGEESLKKYIYAWYNETYWGISWDLVMISKAEMTVVYNWLSYDTRNFDKWEEREAYISEYFALDLKSLAKEIDDSQ